MYIGCPLFRMTPSAVRKDDGQPAGSPKGVELQSCARISAPISSPPCRNAGFNGALGISAGLLGCADITRSYRRSLNQAVYRRLRVAKSSSDGAFRRLTLGFVFFSMASLA